MSRIDRTATTNRVGLLGQSMRYLVAAAIGLLLVPLAAATAAGMTLLRAPLPGELPEERPQITAVPSVVVDNRGAEIGVFRGFDRTVEVTANQVPESLKQALMAIEDRRFLEHNGVDFEGIARAARINLELREVAQGGSTITQQYVKNTYLSSEQTFERKMREALLAIELEKRMTKDEILFGYLETSYYGAGAYGIGAAAEVYFGKRVQDLDVSEAATLAGVVQAPTRLSPRVDLDAAEERRRLVLEAMYLEGYLTEEEFVEESERTLWIPEEGAKPSPTVTVIVPLPPKGATDHPFFVSWVEQELLETLGPDALYRAGLTIETTIDSSLQEEAEAAVARRLENTEYPIEMAAVTIDPRSGEVLAMVGGRDYDASQVNLAIGGSTGFQPGSSFKPIVLAEAFQRGLGPDTVYPAPAAWTMPGCSGDQCTVSNYDHADRGSMTLRDATRASVNTVYAQLISDVSISSTIDLAQSLGLSRFDEDRTYGVSVALGAVESSPLEMASAYGTFANRGVRVEPYGIARVLDADGNVLVDNTLRGGERVLDTVVADNVTDVLVDVVVSGTGRRAAVGAHPIAGKTGTAQEYRAAWFVGFTPSRATAVWMGHADRLASLHGVNGVGRVSGGSHPAIAFSDIMTAALERIEPQAFPEPAEIVVIAESADEVVPVRQEQTTAGSRRGTPSVVADCNGRPCQSGALPSPSLPAIPPPTTEQPPTTAPPTPSPDGTPGTDPAPDASPAPDADSEGQ